MKHYQFIQSFSSSYAARAAYNGDHNIIRNMNDCWYTAVPFIPFVGVWIDVNLS
jgi:hypothetical protein